MNDVRLGGGAIANRRDVAHIDCATIGDPDGEVVELLDRLRGVVELNVVLEAADLRETHRIDLGLVRQRGSNVLCGESARLQCLRVYIDLNLPLFAAERKGHCRTGHCHQWRAQLVQPKIEQLLLGKPFTRECELEDRHG